MYDENKVRKENYLPNLKMGQKLMTKDQIKQNFGHKI